MVPGAKRGAAIGFVLAVDHVIERISTDSGRFPSAPGGCRYCRLKRYPFRLVHREEADRIYVIAVAHAKRRPGYWHYRLKP
jgi:hypothetical protein